ncbi:uncharacterized protein DUF1269 [Frigoribacterium sp. PhB160]|uniref:DUF1269 domain-containing protein n=1 Tax=Frigoribacterium sp. PhB160 TaxID=2485192 RepID=UPI000F4ABDC1|nr:DUF1269 domain-containing protein [Frigoribacterium sp. PhB160]ROS61151.1 uncharacterized protein DUF1269 [Frigoribacterium sp. PhB160]
MSTTTEHDRATTRQILAASFSTPDGGSRAGAAVTVAHPGKIGNTAILSVKSDGTPRFMETNDWGAGRGALVGGAIGLIGGPLGVLAGSGIGVLASKLRDVGFKDAELRELGASLGARESVVVFELATDTVASARRVLESLDAERIVAVPVDTSVADLFASVPAPDADRD